MPEEQAPPSIADSLNAAIETVEQSDPTPAAPAESVDTAAADNTAAPAQETTPTQDRARGPDGKFLKRDAPTDQAAAAAKEGAPAPAANAAATPAATAPAALPADAAPPAWTPAAKEKWATLDPAVKTEIARREKEIDVGMSRAAEARKFGDSMYAEIKPYEQILAQEGASPQAALRALLETSYTLRYGSPEHKHALFMSMAQQYGIDLAKEIDPEKARLQWQLDSRQVNDARQVAAQQEALQRDVVNELQTFIAAPGHEHYATVRTAMAGLMSSGVATTLQDAYDRACWTDPTVRAALQLAENTRRAADQAKNRNALAAVNGAPGSVNPGSGADASNLRGFLEAQFASTAGRV